MNTLMWGDNQSNRERVYWRSCETAASCRERSKLEGEYAKGRENIRKIIFFFVMMKEELCWCLCTCSCVHGACVRACVCILSV